MRRLLLPAIILAALLIGYLLGERRSPSQLWHSMTRPSTGPTGPNDPALQASLPKPDVAAALPPGPLNALLKPDLTPQQQTDIIGQLFLDYWTSTHHLPTGTWEETLAALAGANPQALALVPKDHPALGKTGFQPTPDAPAIRYHIISSRDGAFQLIYDGPDKLPYTADDQVRSFPPDLAVP